MKNFMFIAILLALVSVPSWAGRFTNQGFVLLRPSTVNLPVIGTHPTITPFSNPADPFTLYASETELELTSEIMDAEIRVLVVGQTGIVYNETHLMTIGSEVSIPVSNLLAGAYTIYITYGADVWVGEFEVTND